MSIKELAVREAAAMAPPGGVGGALICGVELSTVVLWLTALYTILNIAFLIYRWRKLRNAQSQD